MYSAQQDDQEDHLEEGDEDVGGGNHKANNTEDGGDGALHNGKAEPVQAVLDLLVWRPVAIQIVVRDVRREIDRKSEKFMF